MKKSIFTLAFVSAAFFFGCSADGMFPTGEPEDAVWSKDLSSNSNSGGGSSGYCLYLGSCIQATSSTCSSVGGTYYSTQSACNSANSGGGSSEYCLYLGSCIQVASSTCNSVGGTYYSTQSACNSANNSGGSSGACSIDYGYAYGGGDYEICVTPITSSECDDIEDEIYWETGRLAVDYYSSNCPSNYTTSCQEYNSNLGKTITVYYYGSDAPSSCN